jgi:VWFA-related protein
MRQLFPHIVFPRKPIAPFSGLISMKLCRLPIFLVLLIVAALHFSGRIAGSQESTPTIRAEVDLVDIIFTATDKNGQPVRGLQAEDFKIFENKQAQKIEYFSDLSKGSEVPLTIALLIDTSGSVKDKLDYEIATASEFFKEILRPNKDLALIIQFDSEVNLVQDFTQNQRDLLKALNSLKAGNSTALYDAIFLAADEKLKGEIGRKVIIVITDGADTSSKVRKEEAIESAQKSDALIYGIGVRSVETDFSVLKRFADETGGMYFSPHANFKEIQDAFQKIGKELQGQYSLAYIPGNKKKDGSFRAIDIQCKTSGVRIRARKGYYALKTPAAE